MALLRVQSTGGVGGSNVASIALPFSTPPQVGNGLVLAVTGRRTGLNASLAPDASITDNYGNRYYTATSVYDSLGTVSVMIFYCPKIVATGPAFTITVAPDPLTLSPNTHFLVGAAVEVGGAVGAGVGINRTATATGSGGTSTSTGLTAALTVDDVFLLAVTGENQNGSATNVLTVESVTPPWVEEAESLLVGAPRPLTEIDTRSLGSATGTTVRGQWTKTLVFGGGNWAAAIVAFQGDVPPPAIPVRVSQVLVEALVPLDVNVPVSVSQVAVEILRAGPVGVNQVSQVAVEALVASGPPQAVVAQIATEVLTRAVPEAALSQVAVEVLTRGPGGPGAYTGAALSQLAVELLVATSAVSDVGNTSWDRAIVIPYLPWEHVQDLSVVLTTTAAPVRRQAPRAVPRRAQRDAKAEEPPTLPLCEARPAPTAYMQARQAEMRARQQAQPAPVGALPASVWYQYTPTEDTWMSTWVRWEPTSGASFYVRVFTDLAGDPDVADYEQLNAAWGPFFFEVLKGSTYHLAIPRTGVTRIRLSVVGAPNKPIAANSVAVNDDGDPHLPLVVMDADTGAVIRLVSPFPRGEFAAVLPNGISCWTSYDLNAYVFARDLSRIAVLTPPEGENYHGFVGCNHRDQFYVCRQRSWTKGNTVFTVAQDGVMGLIEYGPISDRPLEAFGISGDERYLYFVDSSGSGSRIDRWDLLFDRLAAPLVMTGDLGVGQPAPDILTLADGTVIVGYQNYNYSGYEYAVRYTPEGGMLNEYNLGRNDTVDLNHLADAADGTSFWVWLYLDARSEDGRSRFINIRASDGAYLHEFEATQYNRGSFAGDPDYVEQPERFGHAFSCPFVAFTQPVIPIEPPAPILPISGPYVWVHVPVRVLGEAPPPPVRRAPPVRRVPPARKRS